MLTRREWIGTSLVAGAAGCSTNKEQAGWPAAWDRILLEKAAATEAPRFDEKEALVTRLFGPGYRYHTKFREGRVHDLRVSCDYALTLLELRTQNGLARAQQVLNRVCALQNTDPGSEWYGIWGYYLEEPPDKMQEADWNWADVLGGTLLLVAIRHAARLEPGLQARIRASIGHAAQSVQRRDADPGNTSVAVKGSFVCAGAAERLGMTELAEYARKRLARVEALIQESGSFAEYNSPVDARVTLTDLTRIRMYLQPGPVRDSAARIESRLWLHLARHWDGFRRQFAGPMSRCYETDLGEPFWLEKSLSGRLGLFEGRFPDGIKLFRVATRLLEHQQRFACASLALHGHLQSLETGWNNFLVARVVFQDFLAQFQILSRRICVADNPFPKPATRQSPRRATGD